MGIRVTISCRSCTAFEVMRLFLLMIVVAWNLHYVHIAADPSPLSAVRAHLSAVSAASAGVHRGTNHDLASRRPSSGALVLPAPPTHVAG